jgi:transcriptional regulator NrdR family protein
MNCPICQHGEHSVVKTEAAERVIRRRRQCLRCGHRWTTFEGAADVSDELARLKQALGHVAELVR